MTPAAVNNRPNLRPRTPSQLNPFTHRPINDRRVFNNPADAVHSAALSEAADAALTTETTTAATLASQEDAMCYNAETDGESSDSDRVPFILRPGYMDDSDQLGRRKDQ